MGKEFERVKRTVEERFTIPMAIAVAEGLESVDPAKGWSFAGIALKTSEKVVKAQINQIRHKS